LLAAALWCCGKSTAVPTGTASPVPLTPPALPAVFEQVCEETSGAYCDWRINCGFLAPAGRQRCIDALDCAQPRTRTAVANGEVQVDADAGAQCAAVFQSLECDVVELGGLSEVSSACANFLVGVQGVGQPCHLRQSCEQGTYCLIGASCPPTCEALAELGQPCTPDLPCANGLACLHDGGFPLCVQAPPGTCASTADCQQYELCELFGDAGYCVLNAVYVDAGAPCDLSFGLEGDGGPIRLCQFDDYCPPPPAPTQGTCTPIPTLGEPCIGAAGTCQTGTLCGPAGDGGFVCEQLGPPGALCDSMLGCQDFGVCLDGKCTSGSEPGAPCGADASLCLGVEICTGANCAAAANGDGCILDSDCASGFCDGYGDGEGSECLPSCF
jgi:hypothetical protein